MADEVRTTSSTGGVKGVKPQRYDLLPKVALDRISEVYGFGATKYADHNWRKGYEWSKSYAAAMRHMTAFWDGEDSDPESGLPHLAHAAFHLNTLLVFMQDWPQHDDRYRLPDSECECGPDPCGDDFVEGDDGSWVGWEEVGYMTEDGVATGSVFMAPADTPPPFGGHDKGGLTPGWRRHVADQEWPELQQHFQNAINKAAANLASVTETPHSIVETEPGVYIRVDWRDSVPITKAGVDEVRQQVADAVDNRD